jgi:hypothetical protein
MKSLTYLSAESMALRYVSLLRISTEPRIAPPPLSEFDRVF